MTARFLHCCVLVITLSFTTATRSATAITVQLSAAKDNTLFENASGGLSNGNGVGLFAGRTAQFANTLRRALIMFDVAASVPESATINSATLTLNVTAAASGTPRTVELRRLTTDWGESTSTALGGGGCGTAAANGDATWIHSFSPDTAWTNEGGDFSAVPSASSQVGTNGTYDWASTQLTADVQDMLGSPASNFGWLILGDESETRTAHRYGSRESSTPPVLTIDYELDADPLMADFNGDRSVDAVDLATWQQAYGTDAGGDADGDLDTDGSDFLIWQRELTIAAPVRAAAVPEPTAASALRRAAGQYCALPPQRGTGLTDRPK